MSYLLDIHYFLFFIKAMEKWLRNEDMRVGGELRGSESLAVVSSGTDMQVGVTQECRET